MTVTYRFNHEKNALLIKERGIGFEEIIRSISEGNLIDIKKHHNPKDYPNQYIMYVRILKQVYAVPYVEEEKDKLFLKTLFASRKATRYYLDQC